MMKVIPVSMFLFNIIILTQLKIKKHFEYLICGYISQKYYKFVVLLNTTRIKMIQYFSEILKEKKTKKAETHFLRNVSEMENL